jgi:hypothetical protein
MRHVDFSVKAQPIAVLCALAVGFVMAEQADVTTYELKLNLEKDLINDYSKNSELPSFGFTCPRPAIGGEAAALEYRKRGVLLLRTDAADNDTMAFLARYGIKAIVRLKGKETRMFDDAERLSKGVATNVVAGFEIEPCGESEAAGVAAKWERLFPVIAKGFPKAKVILPLGGNKADASIVKAFGPKMKSITHVLYRIPDGSLSPYAPGSEFAKETNSNKMLKQKRIILVMSGKAPGKQGDGALDSTLWKMHAMLTALVIPGMDAFIFDDWPKDGDFALAMRNSGALFLNRRDLKVRAYGEASASESKPAQTGETATAPTDLDYWFCDRFQVDLEIPPHSCDAFGKALAAKRAKGAGDVEWVACTYSRWGGQYVGLLIVNSGERPVRLDAQVVNHNHSAPTYWTIGLGPDGTIVRDAWEPEVKLNELFIEVNPKTFECVLFPIKKQK